LYSIENFERPSVASDCVVFGIDTVDGNSNKNLKQRILKILLVKRGEEPFINQYSLPGGFLRKGETIQQSAIRELEEETGVINPKLIFTGVYSEEGRDPRGWIISCAFLALTRTVELSTAVDSDASEAHWLNFEYDDSENEKITLSDDFQKIVLEYENGKILTSQIAFDHAQIIRDAFLKLRDEVINHDIIFDLMPELFAISDLQQPYETIVGRKTSPQNFRKKISSKITETDFYDKATAHRTSKLYKRKNEKE